MIVAAIGIVIVGGAVAAIPLRIRWLRKCVRASATVTYVGTRQESSGTYDLPETVHVMELSFVAVDGTPVRFTHRPGRAPREALGDHVTVRYRPESPKITAEVPSLGNEIMIWFAALLAAPFGVAFLYAGIQLLRGRM